MLWTMQCTLEYRPLPNRVAQIRLKFDDRREKRILDAALSEEVCLRDLAGRFEIPYSDFVAYVAVLKREAGLHSRNGNHVTDKEIREYLAEHRGNITRTIKALHVSQKRVYQVKNEMRRENQI